MQLIGTLYSKGQIEPFLTFVNREALQLMLCVLKEVNFISYELTKQHFVDDPTKTFRVKQYWYHCVYILLFVSLELYNSLNGKHECIFSMRTTQTQRKQVSQCIRNAEQQVCLYKELHQLDLKYGEYVWCIC